MYEIENIELPDGLIDEIVRAEGDRIVLSMPWVNDEGEPTGLEFEFTELTETDATEISEMATAKKKQGKGFTAWRKKEGRGDVEVDGKKMTDLTIRKLVTGWKGMTNAHLLEIYRTGKSTTWQFKGELCDDKKYNRNLEIPFDIEVRRELAECYSERFLEFVIYSQAIITQIHKESKSAELGN